MSILLLSLQEITPERREELLSLCHSRYQEACEKPCQQPTPPAAQTMEWLPSSWEELKEDLEQQGTVIALGYGSLINLQSLQRTMPRTQKVTSCTIYGFKRLFAWPASERCFEIHGLPAQGHETESAVLNVELTQQATDRVNGIYFLLHKEDLETFHERECDYGVLRAPYSDPEGQLHYGYIVVVPPQDTPHSYLKPLLNYLHIIIEGCHQLGPHFVKAFCENTYLGDGVTTVSDFLSTHDPD